MTDLVHVRPATSQKHQFAFDRVFSPGTGQEMVFDEISELVQSALDGHKVRPVAPVASFSSLWTKATMVATTGKPATTV